jgi:hypothetical protein
LKASVRKSFNLSIDDLEKIKTGQIENEILFCGVTAEHHNPT